LAQTQIARKSCKMSIPALTCNQGHALSCTTLGFFQGFYHDRYCECCSEKIPREARRLHCSECGVNVCFRCTISKDPSVPYSHVAAPRPEKRGEAWVESVQADSSMPRKTRKCNPTAKCEYPGESPCESRQKPSNHSGKFSWLPKVCNRHKCMNQQTRFQPEVWWQQYDEDDPSWNGKCIVKPLRPDGKQALMVPIRHREQVSPVKLPTLLGFTVNVPVPVKLPASFDSDAPRWETGMHDKNYLLDPCEQSLDLLCALSAAVDSQKLASNKFIAAAWSEEAWTEAVSHPGHCDAIIYA